MRHTRARYVTLRTVPTAHVVAARGQQRRRAAVVLAHHARHVHAPAQPHRHLHAAHTCSLRYVTLRTVPTAHVVAARGQQRRRAAVVLAHHARHVHAPAQPHRHLHAAHTCSLRYVTLRTVPTAHVVAARGQQRRRAAVVLAHHARHVHAPAQPHRHLHAAHTCSLRYVTLRTVPTAHVVAARGQQRRRAAVVLAHHARHVHAPAQPHRHLHAAHTCSLRYVTLRTVPTAHVVAARGQQRRRAAVVLAHHARHVHAPAQPHRHLHAAHTCSLRYVTLRTVPTAHVVAARGQQRRRAAVVLAHHARHVHAPAQPHRHLHAAHTCSLRYVTLRTVPTAHVVAARGQQRRRAAVVLAHHARHVHAPAQPHRHLHAAHTCSLRYVTLRTVPTAHVVAARGQQRRRAAVVLAHHARHVHAPAQPHRHLHAAHTCSLRYVTLRTVPTAHVVAARGQQRRRAAVVLAHHARHVHAPAQPHRHLHAAHTCSLRYVTLRTVPTAHVVAARGQQRRRAAVVLAHHARHVHAPAQPHRHLHAAHTCSLRYVTLRTVPTAHVVAARGQQRRRAAVVLAHHARHVHAPAQPHRHLHAAHTCSLRYVTLRTVPTAHVVAARGQQRRRAAVVLAHHARHVHAPAQPHRHLHAAHTCSLRYVTLRTVPTAHVVAARGQQRRRAAVVLAHHARHVHAPAQPHRHLHAAHTCSLRYVTLRTVPTAHVVAARGQQRRRAAVVLAHHARHVHAPAQPHRHLHAAHTCSLRYVTLRTVPTAHVVAARGQQRRRAAVVLAHHARHVHAPAQPHRHLHAAHTCSLRYVTLRTVPTAHVVAARGQQRRRAAVVLAHHARHVHAPAQPHRHLHAAHTCSLRYVTLRTVPTAHVVAARGQQRRRAAVVLAHHARHVHAPAQPHRHLHAAHTCSLRYVTLRTVPTAHVVAARGQQRRRAAVVLAHHARHVHAPAQPHRHLHAAHTCSLRYVTLRTVPTAHVVAARGQQRRRAAVVLAHHARHVHAPAQPHRHLHAAHTCSLRYVTLRTVPTAHVVAARGQQRRRAAVVLAHHARHVHAPAQPHRHLHAAHTCSLRYVTLRTVPTAHVVAARGQQRRRAAVVLAHHARHVHAPAQPHRHLHAAHTCSLRYVTLRTVPTAHVVAARGQQRRRAAVVLAHHARHVHAPAQPHRHLHAAHTSGGGRR
ncbi:unnamed protein product [Euphydryas editha]|uniref:Uncharacterized protein n=1 Tax=Euphydryas editha TaxID=104508 RepID=A0AAU9U2S9_EUPED|nr:unnamed protein product [Euphydryas editha]